MRTVRVMGAAITAIAALIAILVLSRPEFWTSKPSSLPEHHAQSTAGDGVVTVDGPRPPESESDTVSVVVSDPSGSRVHGATVSLWQESAPRWVELGMTDEAGALKVKASMLSWDEVILAASARDYAPVSIQHDGKVSPNETIWLRFTEVSGRIRGRVILQGSGKPPESSIWVCAWPFGFEPAPSSLAADVEHSPFTPVARTDSMGRFELAGLSKSTKWTLAAGGRGLVSSNIPEAVDADPDFEVLISVQATCFAWVQVRSSSGMPPLAPPDSWAPSIALPAALTGAWHITYDDPKFVLATRELGLPVVWPREFELFWMFLTDASPEELGPVSFTAKIPGHPLIDEKLKFHSTGQGSMAPVVITVDPDTPSGVLVLEFVGIPAAVRAQVEPRDLCWLGEVYLQEVSSGDRVQFPVRDLAEVCIFDGIPIGEYSFTFVTYERFYQYPSPGTEIPPIVISSGGAQHCRIDLSELGYIYWEAERETFETCLGMRSVTLVRDKDHSNPIVTYQTTGIIQAIPPGEYMIEVRSRDERGQPWRIVCQESVSVVPAVVSDSRCRAP